MSTDAICTCSHGLGVLRHADDCPVAIERRRPVALSAPSEPVQDKPRVWAMPEIPEDVRTVEDCHGCWWQRTEGLLWRAGGLTGPEVDQLTLIERYSPLTEVVKPEPEATP